MAAAMPSHFVSDVEQTSPVTQRIRHSTMIFASLDFETANHSDASICAAGVAIIDSGEIKESRHWLVRPPKGHGYFREDFIGVHGITWFDVRNAPEFPAIAPALLQYLTSADVVVAHNASFDLRKLCGTLDHFGLPCPAFDYLCTLGISRRVWPDLASHTLDALAAHIGYEFHHHNAQADAEAAGMVLLAMMQHAGARTPRELAISTGVSLGHAPCRGAAGHTDTGTIKEQQ